MSVKQRLLNLARHRGEEFNLVLNRFAIERLLYRLSQSEHRADFVLKGAMAFHVWSDIPHRPTRDVDLLGRGSPDVDRLVNIFRAICETVVQDDGLVFLSESVRGEPIRKAAAYQGVRVRLESRLGSARLPIRVDVGFGDLVVPEPQECSFPALLNHSAPRIWVYRREVTVAEKLHAMVDLGMTNSRLRDFYDLWHLARSFDFDGVDLARAIESTFVRRGTRLPGEVPMALTSAFAADPVEQNQWRAFLRRTRLESDNLELGEIVDYLHLFLVPPLSSLATDRVFERRWDRGGPWRVLPDDDVLQPDDQSR